MEKVLKYLKNPTILIAAASIFIMKIPFFKKKNSLKGKKLNIVITGGSKGIGFNFTKEFLKNGHKVCICSRDKNSLTAAYQELKNENLFVSTCDVSNDNDVKIFTEFCNEKMGSIDLWINNAGNATVKSFEESSSTDIQSSIESNLIGSILCTKHVLEIMKSQENGGHIVMMDGVGSDQRIQSGFTIMGSAKSGVAYFTKSIIQEISGKYPNIGIHRINPGPVLVGHEVSKELGDVLNRIGELPGPVSEYFCEKLSNMEGNNKQINYVSGLSIGFKFIKSLFSKTNYYNENGIFDEKYNSNPKY
jgi:short-subunit dehydrogenase